MRILQFNDSLNIIKIVGLYAETSVIMFGPFGPNILGFVWISTLLLFYVRAYYCLFYPIDFKPWHNDP